jgi:hypothetical protein
MYTIEINEFTGEIIPRGEFKFVTSLGCFDADIVEVSWQGTYGIYAVVYGNKSGSEYFGWIQTINISDDGSISSTGMTSYLFEDSGVFDDPMIIRIQDTLDKYAIVYKGENDNGWIKTICVEENGNIIEEIIDQLEFEIISNNALDKPTIVHVASCVYNIIYRGNHNDRTLAMVYIGINGNIYPDGASNVVKYDAGTDGFNIGVYKVLWDAGEQRIVYALAYRQGNINGYLRIIEITFTTPINQIISKGSDAYGLQIQGTTITGWINEQIVQYNPLVLDDWNYIVLTYNQSWIALYHNEGTEPEARTELTDEDININTNPIILGRDNCIMDYTAIYSESRDGNWIDNQYNTIPIGG